ncbi:MAG TPA: NAD(P)H-hydrate dehydratase [Sphaerochaeta sp.]|nr:NAD(P)H-hydrate dehydratase [Sphaerochaeta sp.]
MKPIVTAASVAQTDQRAQHEARIPALLLMESAGLQAWQVLRSHLTTRDSSLLFLVGGGNNGGDALVVSRYAYNDGYRNQRIFLLGAKPSPSCAAQLLIMETYKVPFIGEEELDAALSAAHWIIDGIAGTGLAGPLRSQASVLVERANASHAQIFSIDIPSGLGDQVPVTAPSIMAACTVTMGALKSAMFHPKSRARCGKIIVVNPSFPPAIIEEMERVACLAESPVALAPLRRDDYKNTRGHLAIFGGSPPYSGALRLSSRAAFAARSGLVTLACDDQIMAIVASEAPSVMVRSASGVDPAAYDVLVAGPGWGGGRAALLKRLLGTHVPLVLDADGITALAEIIASDGIPEHGTLTITPHLGELARLASALGINDDKSPRSFFSMIEGIAERLDAILVVKSSLVHIVEPGRPTIVVDGSNPSLGVAGSGDLLSGIIAALWVSGNDQATAALGGVQVHQEAGRRAHEAVGYYDSEHLVDYIGTVVKEAER